jgi:hypothetical protein
MMPDVLTALFLVLAIFEMFSGRLVLSGVFLSVSIWGKFFPILLLPIMIGYLLAKCGPEIWSGIKNVLKLTVGLVAMTLVLYYPMILEGTVANSFNFLTTRVAQFHLSIYLVVAGLALLALFFIWLSRWFILRSDKSKYVPEDVFMEISLGIMCIPILLWTHTQYFVSVIPLLAYCAAICDRHYAGIWVVLSVGALVTLLTLNTNVLMLNTLVASGLVSSDTVLGVFDTLHTPVLGEYSVINLLTSFGSIVQRAIVAVLIMAVMFRLFGGNEWLSKFNRQVTS